MSVPQAETYKQHPMFRLAMQSLQKGEWQEGLDKLDNLMQAYPMEGELRNLRQEMLLRARIDQDERQERARARSRRLRTLTVRTLTVVALLALAAVVFTAYSRWIGQQVNLARQSMVSQVIRMELAVKFRDAQDYLRAGQTEKGLALLDEIAATDPAYPKLETVRGQAQRQQALDTQYQQARGQLSQGDQEGALATFKAIEQQEPYYRDVKTQIQDLEQQTQLGQMLAKADKAFDLSDWNAAAAAYEQLYLFNPDFRTAYVEDRLFTSYVKAAEMNLYGSESLEAIQLAEEYYRKALALRPQDPATKASQEQVRDLVEERMFRGYIDAAQKALADNPGSIQALGLANDYFREALKLKPDDAEVAKQSELAVKFLEAQRFFSQGNWEGVINDLEYVYIAEAGYAGGVARQALYEAYVARGDEEMAIGDFDTALADFQRAAVLAEEDPSSKLRLYEIQLKIAEAQGVLGDYEEASRLYAAAIDLAGLKERASQHSDSMAKALRAAEASASAGSYRAAYNSYRDAVTYATETFDIVEHTVDSDDYLSTLALEYGSTVSLIAEANNLANPNIIIPGQILLIPILR